MSNLPRLIGASACFAEPCPLCGRPILKGLLIAFADLDGTEIIAAIHSSHLASLMLFEISGPRFSQDAIAHVASHLQLDFARRQGKNLPSQRVVTLRSRIPSETT